MKPCELDINAVSTALLKVLTIVSKVALDAKMTKLPTDRLKSMKTEVEMSGNILADSAKKLGNLLDARSK